MDAPKVISGNLPAAVSEYLPQLHTVNILYNSFYRKSNTYERGWSKFNLENFPLIILQLTGIMWSLDQT